MKKFTGSKYKFAGERLDKFLAIEFPDLSRSKLQKLIKSGDILVNGESSKSAYTLTNLDTVVVGSTEDKVVTLKAEKLDLPILYEDKSVLVVNKPYGMVVHPVKDGQYLSGTVVNAVLNKINKKEFEGLRPGIVHRIDKDTSGALIVAKTKKAQEKIIAQFKERKIQKYYIALVNGILKHPEGVVEAAIGRAGVDRKKMRVTADDEGKLAVSVYKVLETFKLERGRYLCSLLRVQIKTGRTHQIRVHMTALGHSIVGDSVYGNYKTNQFFKKKYGLERQFLHAHEVGFQSPEKDKEVFVTAKLPEDLENVLNQMRKD
jgi:23S rRNA pseudouridine1911/1915/1917 synthase